MSFVVMALATIEVSWRHLPGWQLTGRDADHMMQLVEALEESDDIKNVYSNFDISKEELSKHLSP